MPRLTFVSLINILFCAQNPQNNPYHTIMRSAHVIKGAAANLMCQQLRGTAMNLEHAARAAHEAGGVAAPPELQQAVQARFAEMQQAAQNFMVFLQSAGL